MATSIDVATKKTMSSSSSSIDVDATSKLYKMVLVHIAKHNGTGRLEASIAPAKGKRGKGKSCCGGDDGECSTDAPSSNDRIALGASLGDFSFVDFHNNTMTATHNIVGKPVGTNCGAVVYKSLTVACEGGKDKIVSFFQELVVKSEASTEGFIQIYHWHNKYRYWNASLRIKARPLESVILPNKTTKAILDDFDAFVSEETQLFYEKHGIPYRRSYLFYGVPGAGKTSCIQAIAGAYKRSVSYLNIDPEMTDDGLRAAMDELPEETIVVLEDIDALFTKDRQAKQPKSTLTFTGLLNALDGVGSSMGQLFILTTNLREQLDSALIRNGRVDMQVFFDYANDEQIIKMWNMFYPPINTSAAGEGVDLAEAFCRELRVKLEGKTIAPCALQHFFVSQRTKTAQEALANVDTLLDDLKAKEVEDSKTKEAAAAEKGKDGKGDGEEKDGDDGDDEEKKTAKGKDNKDPATTVHIHFHGDVNPSTTPTTADAPVTTTTADTTTPAVLNTSTANSRSFTVTITTATPTKKEAISVTDDKMMDKKTDGMEGEVAPTQAIDETKTA